jgi:hypothetical protein
MTSGKDVAGVGLAVVVTTPPESIDEDRCSRTVSIRLDERKAFIDILRCKVNP